MARREARRLDVVDPPPQAAAPAARSGLAARAEERGGPVARSGPAGGPADQCGCRRVARRCSFTSSVLLIRGGLAGTTAAGQRVGASCTSRPQPPGRSRASEPQLLAAGPIEASAAFHVLPIVQVAAAEHAADGARRPATGGYNGQ